MPGLRRRLEEQPALAERVVLAGAVERGEIESALAAFDVAVQPAVTAYACPMKVLEYMAAGRAIVAPGSDNVRELLAHGETAWLCPGGPDPAREDLAAAVSGLARDPALRRRLGEEARRRLQEKGWLWEENARRVEDLVGAGGRGRERRTAPLAAASREARSC
jgi:glycosyltransferase involved in cell wall biosynthesis